MSPPDATHVIRSIQTYRLRTPRICDGKGPFRRLPTPFATLSFLYGHAARAAHRKALGGVSPRASIKGARRELCPFDVGLTPFPAQSFQSGNFRMQRHDAVSILTSVWASLACQQWLAAYKACNSDEPMPTKTKPAQAPTTSPCLVREGSMKHVSSSRH